MDGCAVITWPAKTVKSGCPSKTAGAGSTCRFARRASLANEAVYVPKKRIKERRKKKK